jgi:cytochrome c-type biogenesis protein CcmH/NrfG
MPDQTVEQGTSGAAWKAKQVYAMAALCLVVGLALGYLFRGSQSPAPPALEAANPQPAATAAGMAGQMPSLEDMKKMADTKAQPLIDKLKSDPNNVDLLTQIGNIYKATHQFQDAATYYDRVVRLDAKNVAIRTELASCLYYNGDVDGALGQLEQSLHYDPKDANSLFNLGMIKWQGKKDAKGALTAWRELLKTNPQLSADRKAAVEKLMADVQMKGKG